MCSRVYIRGSLRIATHVHIAAAHVGPAVVQEVSDPSDGLDTPWHQWRPDRGGPVRQLAGRANCAAGANFVLLCRCATAEPMAAACR